MVSVKYLTLYFLFFFFNDTATTEIYTLSLHDALPICYWRESVGREVHDDVPYVQRQPPFPHGAGPRPAAPLRSEDGRSEEHTSELQSRSDLVCRLLLEKKKNHTRHLPLRVSCTEPSLA